jgi:hypothetical protein
MSFWAVNEITELDSGKPAPQFGDESSWMRGSKLVQGSSGSCVSFRLIQGIFAYPLRCVHSTTGGRGRFNTAVLHRTNFDIGLGPIEDNSVLSRRNEMCAAVCKLWTGTQTNRHLLRSMFPWPHGEFFCFYGASKVDWRYDGKCRLHLQGRRRKNCDIDAQ